MSDNVFFDGEVKPQVIDTKKKSPIKKNSNYADELVLGNLFDGAAFDEVEEKKKVVENLKMLTNMPVAEFTFKKKFEELQLIKNNPDISNLEREAKARIWSPVDINDEDVTIKEIENLQPKMKLVRTSEDERLWTTLRYYCSTAEYNQAPGRFLKFLLMDDVTGQILGICSVASDVISISDRDKYIGWKDEDKLDNKMLRYSAIGTTIVPTQPLGSNFLGGKLTAAMVTSKDVRDAWEFQDYGQSKACKMVGMTTTSLYGRPSMYDALKWWDGVGLSKGKIPVKPEEDIYETWHAWLKRYRSDDYNKAMTQKDGVSGPVTGAKMRVLNMIFKECGIKQSQFVHGFERGVYYSCFYENTKDFLCRKISEDKLVLKPLFKNDIQAIMDWWKPAAIKRYKKLKADGRLNPDKLYYKVMDSMTYEEAKAKFLKNVNVGKDKQGN